MKNTSGSREHRTRKKASKVSTWVGERAAAGPRRHLGDGRLLRSSVIRSVPIPEGAQAGDELYANNDFDRGHLVRREDPNWGPTAGVANRDTFHFTNCAPQLSAFNQRTWLSLEDYILTNTRRIGKRASVFTGPVFRQNDPVYRDVAIPLAYWKVVAFHP